MDRRNLESLYEQVWRNDYFLENEEPSNFDWERFFSDDYVGGIYSSFLIESYEKIVNLEPFEFGIYDEYRLVLNNGLEFTLKVNYNNADHIRSLGKLATNEAQVKGRQDIIDGYQSFVNIKDGEYVALVEFKDSKGRHGQTGEVGPSAKEVFSMVIQAMSDSLANSEMFSKIVGVMMLVDNNEIKRLELYKKLLQRKLKRLFPLVFTDENTKSLKNMTILIATKHA